MGYVILIGSFTVIALTGLATAIFGGNIITTITGGGVFVAGACLALVSTGLAVRAFAARIHWPGK